MEKMDKNGNLIKNEPSKSIPNGMNLFPPQSGGMNTANIKL
jgi:hypothetical protein